MRFLLAIALLFPLALPEPARAAPDDAAIVDTTLTRIASPTITGSGTIAGPAIVVTAGAAVPAAVDPEVKCPSGQWTLTDPAGVTSCSELPLVAEQLPNPIKNPVATWDDAKAARKTSWPLAVWASLAMLGKGLAYGRESLLTTPIIGSLAKWLSIGKRAMWVAAIGAVGAAGYDVLMSGGSVVAALVASGIAIAGITHSSTKGVPPPTPVAVV